MSSGSTAILKSNENVTFILNPSITYFKSVYRKHTKFIIHYKEEQATSDNSTFSSNKNSINIDLNGHADLLCDISLKVLVDKINIFKPSQPWPDDISLFLVDNITLHMVGPNFDLDKLDKDYINFNAMLNNPKSNNSTYNLNESGKLTCNDGNNYQNMALCGGVINSKKYSESIKKMTAIVPLPFAFSKSIGNALPLCSLNLNQTKVRIIITCRSKEQEGNKFDKNDSETNNNIIDLFQYSIISKYIFLSDEEKLRFKNSKQEYLYERVNILNSGSAFTETINSEQIPISRLINNKPIKQIYLLNTNGGGSNNFNKLKYNLFINKQKMFSDNFNHEFFSKIEILNKFKGCIYNNNSDLENGLNTILHNNIALIDFSLKNSEGPSGCIDPDNNIIHLNIISDDNNNNYSIKIYIVCYYLLTISNETINYMFE